MLTVNICRAKCGWYIFIWQERPLHMDGCEWIMPAEGEHPCTISGPPSYLCHPQKPSHVLSATSFPPINSQEAIQGGVLYLEDQHLIGTRIEIQGTTHLGWIGKNKALEPVVLSTHPRLNVDTGLPQTGESKH